MTDLKSPTAIWAKGILFLLIGSLASVLVILQHPTIRTTTLHILAIWAFCRCYYFAFYVIEHYVDSNYRFAGLLSFLRYAFRKNRMSQRTVDES